MTAKRSPSHALIIMAILFILGSFVLSAGCLDDDDDDSNSAPVAKASADPKTVEVNYEVRFSAEDSSDPDGDSSASRRLSVCRMEW